MSETPIDARLGQYAEMEMELEEWGTDFNPPKPSIKQKSSNPTSTKTSTALHENKFQYATDGLNLHHNSDVGEISGAMPSSKVHLDQQSDVKPKRTKLENDLSKRESLDSQIWMEKGEAMPLEEDDGLSIKFSLSQDEDVYVTGDKDDALFTDYFMRNSPKESFDDNRFLPPTDTFPNQGALLPSPLQLQGDEHFDFPDSINSPAATSGIPLPKLQTHSSPTSPPRNPTFATGHAPSSPLDCHNQQQVSDNDELGGSKLESPPVIKNEYRNDKPSNKNEDSWKSSNLSTPPRFPVELTDHEHEVHISPYTIEFAPNTGPRQHTSPGRTIYNVPSKSPSHLTSHKDSPPSPYEPHPWPPPPSRSNHSTPSSVHHQRNSETPPRYARGAQRGDARLRNHGATPAVTRGSGPNKEVTPHHHHRTSHPRMTGNGSSDLIVTPYPSELRSAVSAESTSPLMLHQPDHSRNMHSPPARHPHHHTPSHHPQSVCGGSAGSHGTPYPPPTYSNSDPKWSESLHLAPLPPFVAHQRGGVHPPSWSHHPSVPPGSHAYPPAPPGQNPGWNTGAHGHPYYSPYYHQHMLPPSEHASNHTPSQCHQPHRSMSNTSRPTSSNSGTPTAQHATESLHWRQKYHQLHLFKKQFGHCNVPPGYGAGTEWKGLYNWVMDQRYQHQRLTRGEPSTMTPARGRMLSSLGFTWDQSVDYGHGSQGVTPNHVSSSSKNNNNNNNKSYSSWDKWMSLLAEYRAKHGNVDVPLKYEPNPSLGTFVNRQRTEHRKMQAGKPCSMTKERVHDLNRLGFTWAIRESHTSWEDRFAVSKWFGDTS